MKRLGLCALVLSVLLLGCSTKKSKKEEVTLVLDYVPNTNHSGIYVALEKGYYDEVGIELNVVEPGNNNTSATLVASGQGDFGVSYQEDVTYARTSKEPLPIKAIATIMQHNTSGFVATKESGITSPKDFEGKVYAGWQSPSETAVIQAVMKNYDANPDNISIVGSSGSGMAQLGNGVDLLWVFEGWDLVKAKDENLDLTYMPLKDLDKRLDYYTPVIIGNDKVLKNKKELTKNFMDATKKGYEYAIKNPDETAKILHKYAPEYSLDFLKESQAFVSRNYQGNESSWGVMKDEVWKNYTDFMFENKLIDKKVKTNELYTNEFIDK